MNQKLRSGYMNMQAPSMVVFTGPSLLTFYNFEQEDDNGYTKTTTFEGNKAVERFEKNNSEVTIIYFTGYRYPINLKSEIETKDQLSSASKVSS